MSKNLSVVIALVAAALGGLSAPVQAQHATGPLRVLSLEELIRDARQNNPSLRAARLGAEALATRREQVSSLPDPTIMAAYRPFGIDAAVDAVPGLSLQQMVPFPGKLSLAGEIADHAAEAAALRTDAFAQDLALQIKLTYYDLYLHQEHDRHVQHFQRTLQDFEEIAAVRYEVGQGGQQAILKAQLEKNALARERIMLTEKRRNLIETLARLTNRPDLVAHAGEVVVTAPDVPLDTTVAVQVALAKRPEVEALKAEMEGADAEVDLARKNFLPDFTLEAGFMDMSDMNRLVNLGNRFMIGGGITIPLQTGRRRAALEEAKLRRSQVDAHYEALQTEIQTRVNELNSRLREQGRALALYDQTLVPQAETTLEATLSAYTTGRADFLDLLDAERMVFNVHVERERTYAAYLMSGAELERVIGIESLHDATLAQIGRRPTSIQSGRGPTTIHRPKADNHKDVLIQLTPEP